MGYAELVGDPHAPVSPRAYLGTYSCSQEGRAASQARHLLLHAH